VGGVSRSNDGVPAPKAAPGPFRDFPGRVGHLYEPSVWSEPPGKKAALRLANASSLQQRAACRGSLTSTQQPHSARRRTTPASSLRTLAAIWTRCWSCRSCIATGPTSHSSSSMASWSAFGLATIPPSGRGARWSRSARGCRASAKPTCVCLRRRSAFWLTLARLDSCLQHTQFQGTEPGRLVPRLPASIPGVGARWRRIHLRPRVQGVSGPSCGGCRHSACGACSPATRCQAHVTIRDAGTVVKMYLSHLLSYFFLWSGCAAQTTPRRLPYVTLDDEMEALPGDGAGGRRRRAGLLTYDCCIVVTPQALSGAPVCAEHFQEIFPRNECTRTSVVLDDDEHRLSSETQGAAPEQASAVALRCHKDALTRAS